MGELAVTVIKATLFRPPDSRCSLSDSLLRLRTHPLSRSGVFLAALQPSRMDLILFLPQPLRSYFRAYTDRPCSCSEEFFGGEFFSEIGDLSVSTMYCTSVSTPG